MSKRHQNHAATAANVRHLLNEVTKLSKDDLNSLYGVELRDDGSVYDSTYAMAFKSLGEWAQFSVEQDNDPQDDELDSHRGKYSQDDEY